MDEVTFVFGDFTNIAEPALGDPSNPDPSLPEVFTIAHLDQGSYNQFITDTRYATDTGLRVIPKASSSEKTAIANSLVRIHRGLSEKTIVWTVERCNAKPKLPKLDTGNQNEIPIRQEITFANKLQLSSGNTVYRVSGVNYYVLLKPLDGTSKYPIGTTPAEISPSADNFYEPSDFTQEILDAAFADPGGRQGLPVAIRVGT